ncbi:MAG: DUF3037 domain-containing protein [Ginsengibacter sp.]
MQENNLFEYAVIRIVPRVEREEFLNVGIVLYCRDQNFLQMIYHLDTKRIKYFCEQIDIEELEKYLQIFDSICKAAEDSGPIGQLSIPERFRWLTATRSTVIQTSKVHPGFSKDPAETLIKLFNKLVL